MSVRRTTLFLTATSAAALIALAGCGGASGDKSTSSGAARNAVPNAAAAAPDNPDLQKDAGAGTAQQAPVNIAADTRAIIYAGTMTVRVTNVDDAAAKAVAFATGAGGFVGADNRQRDDQRSQAQITLRVPAEKFTLTLDGLKALGNEESRTINAQDVTDQVADVDSRITNAQASVDRIRVLMAKATTIAEITSVESELSRREADLESLKARQRRLDGLTSLSTITLTLLGPEAAVTTKQKTGFLVGFKAGWSAFKTSLLVVLTVLAWLAPWALLVGVPIWLLIRLVRRFRPRRPALVGGSPFHPIMTGPQPQAQPQDQAQAQAQAQSQPMQATPAPGGPSSTPVPPSVLGSEAARQEPGQRPDDGPEAPEPAN